MTTRAGDKAYRATRQAHQLTIFISHSHLSYFNSFLIRYLSQSTSATATQVLELPRRLFNMTPLASDPQVHYTVFVRLPFPRGDFMDPPPVSYD